MPGQKDHKRIFTRFVELGRAVVITYGPQVNKVAVVVDIIDHSRILVEGTNVPRMAVNLKWISLTPLVVPQVQRGAGSKAIKAQISAFGLDEKFNKSRWGTKISGINRKRTLTDFERFRAQVLIKRVNAAVAAELKTMRPAKKAAAAGKKPAAGKGEKKPAAKPAAAKPIPKK
eukprot:TRINITY_DN2137_c0_g1_i1.p1 TRINITY_DN2137_c0_g1~~TRINITY_DN2137_c0_g1_i1.p1  ORF type:complete len:200 (+),score=51.46 TRINITY_DN2137_c0_g1_i1:82-600(+)